MINLFQIFPETVENKDFKKLFAEATEFLQERERLDVTRDEIAFLMTINRYIEIFERAKSMLANNKFTVEYKGDAKAPSLKIEDFEIIPVHVRGNT